MEKQDKRCITCILPSNYPTISFNESGECAICTNWKKKWKEIDFKKQEKILDDNLSKYRGKSKPYDCIIGLSGGKDSSYAAYILRKKGMSPLAVTFDNGFMSEVAYHNINETVRSLSLGHVVIKQSQKYMQNLYKTFLITAGEFCSVCNVAIRVVLYRTARNFNIRLIISGRSSRTEANSPMEFFTCSPGYFKNVAQTFLSNKEIDSFRYFNQVKRAVWDFSKHPYFIELPSYIPWDEKEMIEIMKNELNWEGLFGEQHVDCEMNHAKEYLKLKKFGVPELTAKISSLVRDNQMSRSDAMAHIEKYINYLIENEGSIREKIQKKLNISGAQLDKAIKQSHVPYLSKMDVFLAKIKNKILPA